MKPIQEIQKIIPDANEMRMIAMGCQSGAEGEGYERMMSEIETIAFQIQDYAHQGRTLLAYEMQCKTGGALLPYYANGMQHALEDAFKDKGYTSVNAFIKETIRAESFYTTHFTVVIRWLVVTEEDEGE